MHNHNHCHPMSGYLSGHHQQMGGWFEDLKDAASDAFDKEVAKIPGQLTSAIGTNVLKIPSVEAAATDAAKKALADQYAQQALSLEQQVRDLKAKADVQVAKIPGGWITIAGGGVVAALLVGKLIFGRK